MRRTRHLGPNAFKRAGGSGLVRVLLLSLMLVSLAGCLGGQDPDVNLGGVTIAWTDHGIPHITSDTFYGAGVGAGWAAANDNLCMLAEEYVTVAGERSRYFGPASYQISSNGQTYTNIQSDTFHRIFQDPANGLIDSSAHWDDPRGQDLLAGYVEGYNRYLDDLPAGRHEACREAPWLRPITEADMERRVNKLQLLASSLFFAPYMVDASPLPGLADDVPIGRWPTPENLGLGSNGYAFGSDATGGSGMVLGNPHFSWHGPERFAQLHITVPGEYDVMGAALLGVPLVLIGFNEDIAWTHTVSTGWRFSAYELKLVPGNPMQYLHDGQIRDIEVKQVEVPVLRPGGLVTETHGISFSHYGPIIEFSANAAVGGVPGPAGDEVGLMWTPATAYTIRDANAENPRIFEQFFAFGTAGSVGDIETALEDVHGVPWVNTIAADRHGNAFYADISVVPDVPDALWDACNTVVGQALTAAANLPVFDGSTSDCDWRSRQLPASDMPRTTRSDWVLNSNDSYWLPHPDGALEGYGRMIGTEQSERSQRTRMGYVLIDDMLADGPLSLEELQDGLFSSRLHAAEDALDNVLSQTCAVGYGLASDGAVIDFDTPCKVLAAWDRTADVDARGLALFERFWLAAPATWATPFDAENPVATPTDYIGADPRAVRALADAVRELDGAGIPLDAPVRDVRCVERGRDCIPVHGARSELGSPSYITFEWSADGWGDVVHGNSYIQTVTWDGGVVAEALLAYSQSSDPASPFAADQTLRYAQKDWIRLPFTPAQVAAATQDQLVLDVR